MCPEDRRTPEIGHRQKGDREGDDEKGIVRKRQLGLGGRGPIVLTGQRPTQRWARHNRLVSIKDKVPKIIIRDTKTIQNMKKT